MLTKYRHTDNIAFARSAFHRIFAQLKGATLLKVFFCALLFSLYNGSADASETAAVVGDTVLTESGPVVGEMYAASRAFLSIPYAEPPLDDLRWANPVPIKPWAQPRYAGENVDRPLCPSVDNKGYVEDCLVLNIWTPHTAIDSPKPVMFWIHGGGFRRGTSSSDEFEGRNLAEMHNVVVVTINYRLGPLGFLAHPDLPQSSGNQGFLDQQLALRWVKDNIAQFGGDPHNITLFGESAGAISICLHLVAPQSEGLFHRAIMQSGACSEFLPDGLSSQSSHEDAIERGLDLSEALGCGNADNPIKCMRDLETNEIVEALPGKPGYIIKGEGVNWFPNIDGEVLPDLAFDMISRGEFHRVPLLIGTNKNEGGVFVALALTEKSIDLFFSKAKYIKRLERRFGEIAPQVVREYPYEYFPFTYRPLSELVGDMFFVCPTRRTARTIQSFGVPTYLYQFSVVRRNIWGLLGARHASELPFVFHTAKGLEGFTRAERSVSREIMRYWTNFARTGNPNGDDYATWPEYTASGDQHLDLGLEIQVGSGLKADICDFWDDLQEAYPDPINNF